MYESMTGSDCLVIFTTEKQPWFNSGGSDATLSINPVGKGKGPKKLGVKSRASANSGPAIVNPCFVAMSAMCIDPFWKTTFTDASYGKFHRGFRFDSANANLTYKLKNKTKSCNIVDRSVYDSILIVQKFMNDTAGIMSATDVDNRKKYLDRLRIQNTDDIIDSWGRIKSENHKQILICGFVEMVSKYYNLCESEIDQLSETIRLGVAIKKFDLTNIQMNNGAITNINGLVRRPNGTFEIDPNIIMKTKPHKTHVKTVVCEDDDEDNIVYGKVNILKKFSKLLDTISKKGIIKSNANLRINESISESDPLSGVITS